MFIGCKIKNFNFTMNTLLNKNYKFTNKIDIFFSFHIFWEKAFAKNLSEPK